MADVAPCMWAHGLDEAKARVLVQRHFATGNGMQPGLRVAIRRKPSGGRRAPP